MAGSISTAWRLGNAALKRRRSVGDTVSDLTDPGLEPQTSRFDNDVLTTEITGRYELSLNILKQHT